ncbi:aminoacyl tRNA synthase complex-interacting multifunctional protein 1-like isoform X1 [Macrosteles quadrilineatus]|uniref:aminoacyl tRNA synthase complex-interacting multifunctional protein 1-like isoform X1 n=1 Tax=Macrosteles quadrilineatus TaxID=74068 RepID=UPI0023E284C9|nr:aminoacyl tRNA synthase complex-interacting multifunctional protein 1-like isoform X1 [Macrosteles quadrilineatus]
MRQKKKSVLDRVYNDEEDNGLSLYPGYPGTPPPTPENGWIPYQHVKIENIHDPPKDGCNPPMAEDPVDIRRFELLVGRIEFAKIHPAKPDSWVLTYVDCGFKFPIPIVSSIGKFYDKEKLEKRKVVALCNIEPTDDAVAGNTAMLMCGATVNHSNPDDVIYELWNVPKKAKVGDPLRCENYPLYADMNCPERPFMHDSENTFNDVIADMRINESRQVVYKNEKLFVRGLTGKYIKTPSLADCGIKASFV